MKAIDRFTGAWRLLSCEGRWSDGRVTFPYGERPGGMLMYDGNGHFSGQIMARGRPGFATGNLLKGTGEEVRAAFEGYIAYYGTCSVDEERGLVVHNVEGSFFPNWVGDVQTRAYEFQGDTLQLSTMPIRGSRADLTVVLVWERAVATSPAIAGAEAEINSAQ